MHSGVAETLVGRQHHMELISSLMEELVKGLGGVILLQGEPGIGKSALLAAALADALDKGLDVRHGVCDELNQRLSLAVVQQTLANVFGPGRQRADTDAVAAHATSEGARSHHGARLVAGDPVTAAAEELLVLVDRLCAAGPVVLALDDLQLADEATLLVWRRLCRTALQRPLLLIGACRLVPQRAELDLLRRDVRDHAGTTLTLERLSEPEVAELARRISGRTAGPRLLGRLKLATGNPLYVREIMDALIRAGALQDNGQESELGPTAPPRPESQRGGAEFESMSLSEVIADRLAFLSAETRDVLRSAALLPPAFAITDMTVLLGRPAVVLTAPVREAVAAGVLEPADGDRLRFRHGLIRQALYALVPAALRIALHRDAAQALIARGSSVERVAEQLLPAADATDGWEVDWLADNAAALTRRAPDAAVTLLQRAVAHRTDDARTLVLLDHLASAAFLAADYEQAKRAAQRVLAHAGDAEQRGRAAWILGYALLRTARAEEAMTDYQKAMTIVQEVAAGLDADTRWHARLRVFVVFALMHLGRSEEAAAEAAAVLVVGTQLSDAMSIAYTRHILSVAQWNRQDLEGALDHLTRGIALTGSDPELLDLRLLMQGNQAGLLLDMDRFTQAREVLADARALAERTGNTRLGPSTVRAGELALYTGRWDDALTELATLSDDDATHRQLVALTHGVAAVVTAHRDEQAVARHHLHLLEELPATSYNKANLAYRFQARAMVTERSGDLPSALSGLQEVLDSSYEVMADRARVLPLLVRLALAAGDREVAERAVACVEADEARSRLPRVAAARMWCHGLLGFDPALVLDAAGYYRKVGRPAEMAQALEDAADLLASAGQGDPARDALNDAMLTYTDIGAVWDSRRAAARLRVHGVRLGVRGARGRPRTGWIALTDTEQKVTELVAAGLSNPDIADALVLSRRTVETHVSHIVAKLEVKSRREVAGVAQAHRS
ncbi:ATP-binding protein [Actinopolymorpha pittospori]|uniref:DNA-binding NarL/FixJ family response regulator n=1 Tax=Actinopolymorpha pittospori TaxID=648752 RepID=A0A927MVL1_9ACTN|nr:LuxR family transcriptional regulator [Actinopolymorpha pittospori]MBE1604122.1 DNA-binding NarL/FixJ family response regulator [Actinopolymorpha pittospori]